MSLVRVESFSISLDGYGAGAEQTLANPLGIGGESLHKWFIPTRTFQTTVCGNDGGTTGVDDDFAARGMRNMGAWILGRNMFSHSRGPWTDDGWQGWWGDNPPYHCPVFVLTHHPKKSIEMQGGTVFHFITTGIHDALQQAKAAAGEKDIRIGGGVSTIQQYLKAKLIDELHIAISPTFLGRGERLFENIILPQLGYECKQQSATENATHIIIGRTTK